MTEINELGAAFMSGFKVGDKIISMDAQGQVRLFLEKRHKAYMWEGKLISWNVL